MRSEDCTRCDATMVYERTRHPQQFHLDIRVENVYHHHEFHLCMDCREDLLDWVEMDVERDRIQLPPRVESLQMLERTAERLQAIVDEVDDHD